MKTKLIALAGLLVIGLTAGCQDSTWTEADSKRLTATVKTIKDLGIDGDISLRTGRPFLAGMFNGFLLVPGTEVDIYVDMAPEK